MRKPFKKFRFLFVPVLFLGFALTLVPLLPATAEQTDTGVGSALDWIENVAEESPFQDLRMKLSEDYGIRINPYFKSQFDLTSNVYGEPADEQQDVLWTFSPGVKVNYANEFVSVGTEYQADFHYFTKESKENEQDQSFAAFVDIHPNEKWSIRASESLNQKGATAGDQNLEPINYLDNTVNASIGYVWDEKTDSEIGYRNFSREYAGDLYDRNSYIENFYFARSNYKLNESTKVFGGFDLGFVDYDETDTRDAIFYEWPVGIQGKLPVWDIDYYGSVSAYLRNVEANDSNNFWAFLGSAWLSKKFNENKTTVKAGFIRRPGETTFNDIPIYDEKTMYANATHLFSRKLRGRMDISYSNRDYEDIGTVGNVTLKRDDDVLSYGLGFDYAVRKWLVFNLDYSISVQDSNFSDFDYNENRMTLGMTIPV